MSPSPVPSPDLEALIARTSLKYDLLPYTSNPFPQTHPARLAAIARLFGLPTAPVENARVIELGCAAGGNIIPHAVRFPEARFEGVDLSRSQVAAGRTRIAQLGLRNAEIHCKSFTELDPASGSYDYVICHGVYSWVPAPVRDALLRICSEQLSPVGVAVISYNVLPGWRLLQALRDCFMLHGGIGTGREQIAKSRALLEFLKDSSPDTGAYKQLLETWASRLANLPDDYIGHEFLEEINEPCTFQEFAAVAGRHGLGYLGDADMPSMILDNQPAHLAQKVRELGQNQQVAIEQYLDMLTGRTFRQSILVKANRLASVRRNLTSESIEGMSFLTSELKSESEASGGGALTDGFGRRLSTTEPAIMSALGALIDRYPASSTLTDLLATQPDPQLRARLAPALRDALYKMVIAGLALPLTSPIPACSTVSARPSAWPVAQLDARLGHAATTSLRHERVGLDGVAQALLPLLDGTRDVEQLSAVVTGALEAGRLTLARDGIPVTDKAELGKLVPAHVQGSLAAMARAGLLQA